jgi:ribosomal protein S11
MGAKIGKICIKGSYNNIILTLTDQRGDTKGWVSAGTAGFKMDVNQVILQLRAQQTAWHIEALSLDMPLQW